MSGRSRLVSDVCEMLAEQGHYRELLFGLTSRDLLLRYKQTVMGFAWAMFMPLLNTIVFSIIFTRVARIHTDVPYPVFAYCGLLGWNFTASALRFSVTSLTSNTSLVTKVYFPREIFPFSAVLVALVDFAAGSVVLAGLMAYYHVGVTPVALMLPAIVLLQAVFTAGLALLISMANLFYRDVKYLFEIVLTVWMFSTSVLYPLDAIGGRVGQIVRANPMTPIIDAYRSVLLRGELPAAAPLCWASAIAIVLLCTAWVWFHRSEFRFAETA